jgi:hypothetical protein
VEAGLDFIQQRADHADAIPASVEYFLTSFNALLANPTDKAIVNKRAKRRSRVMPTEAELLTRSVGKVSIRGLWTTGL